MSWWQVYLLSTLLLLFVLGGMKLSIAPPPPPLDTPISKKQKKITKKSTKIEKKSQQATLWHWQQIYKFSDGHLRGAHVLHDTGGERAGRVDRLLAFGRLPCARIGLFPLLQRLKRLCTHTCIDRVTMNTAFNSVVYDVSSVPAMLNFLMFLSLDPVYNIPVDDKHMHLIRPWIVLTIHS